MKRMLLWIFISLCCLSTLQACWVSKTLRQAVAGSSVVVVGKIKSTDTADGNPGEVYLFDAANSVVSKVIKNELKDFDVVIDATILLSMPSTQNLHRMSTDTLFEAEIEGV